MVHQENNISVSGRPVAWVTCLDVSCDADADVLAFRRVDCTSVQSRGRMASIACYHLKHLLSILDDKEDREQLLHNASYFGQNLFSPTH